MKIRCHMTAAIVRGVEHLNGGLAHRGCKGLLFESLDGV